MALQLYIHGEIVPRDKITSAVRTLLGDSVTRSRTFSDNAIKILAAPNAEAQERISSFMDALPKQHHDAIDFLPEPEITPGHSVTEESEITRTIIVAASKAFSDQLGDHFLLTENAVVVNPDSPPSLDDAYLALGQLADIRDTAAKLTEFATWRLGAILDACECFFGEDFNLSQIVAQTPAAYNTCVTALRVYREFGMNRFPLSFTHHKEVFYRKIPKDAKLQVLGLAAELQLTANETRNLASFVQHSDNGFAALTPEQKADRTALVEVVSVRSSARKFFFTLDGKVRFFSGHINDLPGKAEDIIDSTLKAYVFKDDKKSPVEIEEWKSPNSPTTASKN